MSDRKSNDQIILNFKFRNVSRIVCVDKAPPSFIAFRQLARNLFQNELASKEIRLKYHDEEGDLICLDNDMELAEAFYQLKKEALCVIIFEDSLKTSMIQVSSAEVNHSEPTSSLPNTNPKSSIPTQSTTTTPQSNSAPNLLEQHVTSALNGIIYADWGSTTQMISDAFKKCLSSDLNPMTIFESVINSKPALDFAVELQKLENNFDRIKGDLSEDLIKKGNEFFDKISSYISGEEQQNGSSNSSDSSQVVDDVKTKETLLEQMGFVNRNLNLALLYKYNGDVAKVVQELLN
eukprot:TRINITY_DN11814_c0_g1_i1.p1 TRINITY_DN11814_c0_g1~~TRINITY_DN11814_c0_g1_i1.p1  ORF type:complete len:292 (+),score=45.62 TRINITY_DN11814_c0_g1_i1:52-927(+)